MISAGHGTPVKTTACPILCLPFPGQGAIYNKRRQYGKRPDCLQLVRLLGTGTATRQGYDFTLWYGDSGLTEAYAFDTPSPVI